MSDNRVGVAYIQLRKQRGYANSARRLSVVGLTQSPPDQVKQGCIVVNITIEAPDSAWSIPETTVVVPDNTPNVHAAYGAPTELSESQGES